MELNLAAEAQVEKQYVQQNYCSDEYACNDRGDSTVNECAHQLLVLSENQGNVNLLAHAS